MEAQDFLQLTIWVRLDKELGDKVLFTSDGSGQEMARSLSHVKKMERTASSSRFSINKEEDVKELSELRQTFEDVTGNDEALKTLAYKMIRESLLGKHLRADVVDVIEEFEHGRLLTLVKDKKGDEE